MKKAIVNKDRCVACGSCVKICPKNAIKIAHGISAIIEEKLCVGCGMCASACPASIICVR